MTSTSDTRTGQAISPPIGQAALEDAVLTAFEAVSAGASFQDALTKQLASVAKISREMTPSGFYLELGSATNTPVNGVDHAVPGKVEANFPGRPPEQFADFILKVDGAGQLRELEGFCYAGGWPSDVSDFTIRSSKEHSVQ